MNYTHNSLLAEGWLAFHRPDEYRRSSPYQAGWFMNRCGQVVMCSRKDVAYPASQAWGRFSAYMDIAQDYIDA